MLIKYYDSRLRSETSALWTLGSESTMKVHLLYWAITIKNYSLQVILFRSHPFFRWVWMTGNLHKTGVFSLFGTIDVMWHFSTFSEGWQYNYLSITLSEKTCHIIRQCFSELLKHLTSILIKKCLHFFVALCWRSKRSLCSSSEYLLWQRLNQFLLVHKTLWPHESTRISCASVADLFWKKQFNRIPCKNTSFGTKRHFRNMWIGNFLNYKLRLHTVQPSWCAIMWNFIYRVPQRHLLRNIENWYMELLAANYLL